MRLAYEDNDLQSYETSELCCLHHFEVDRVAKRGEEDYDHVDEVGDH